MSDSNSTTPNAEEWRPVLGFPGYEVSNMGRVLSRKLRPEGKLLKPNPDTDGYLKVCLCERQKRTTRLVHRLVLESFVSPRPEGMEACHNNGVHTDNRLSNLRWDTHKANNQDQVKHGTQGIKPGWQEWHKRRVVE